MDGVDNIVPQLKAARQSVMVSFYLHSLLTSSVSPVPFVHAKLDKDILRLWLSGMLHFPGLAFTGVSFLNATATGCIYILDMLRCFVPILGPMFLAWDECMKCLYLFCRGKPPPLSFHDIFTDSGRQGKCLLEVNMQKKIPKEELIFFQLWTHTKEMNSGTHSGHLHSTCVPMPK